MHLQNLPYCVRQASVEFERWGPWALVFGKFVPGVNAVTAPLAGVMRIGWARFFVLTSLGSSLWAALAVGAGAWFNRQVDQLLDATQAIGAAAILGMLALLVAYIAFKYCERRRFQQSIRMARISVEELRSLMDQGQAPFIVDVRPQSERVSDGRSIPGAFALRLRRSSA
jgi:hypothetical protein